VLGISLVGSIGSMMGVMYTSPENTVQKHAFWLVSILHHTTICSTKFVPKAFNACQAATLSPLFFFSPAILSRAALYTCGVVGSLSYVLAQQPKMTRTSTLAGHCLPASLLWHSAPLHQWRCRLGMRGPGGCGELESLWRAGRIWRVRALRVSGRFFAFVVFRC
jgi:hypothetical protein